MRKRQVLLAAVVAASIVAFISIAQIRFVSAQQGGEAGVGGVGGVGGTGGAGGAGGAAGGGGGFYGGSGGGALSAYGDYVYVLQQGILYQFAAYDLRLVKKSDLGGNIAINRGRRGPAGGRGGEGGEGGGQGGDGGAGGGGAFGRSEDVAAFGEFVYVLQGKTLRKLYADGLKAMKAVKLDFDVKAID